MSGRFDRKVGEFVAPYVTQKDQGPSYFQLTPDLFGRATGSRTPDLFNIIQIVGRERLHVCLLQANESPCFSHSETEPFTFEATGITFSRGNLLVT